MMPQTVHLNTRIAGGISFILLIILSACGPIIPASPPTQLQATPDRFISLDDDTLYTPAFTVQYPYGWRVVKLSPAGAPLQFAFVDPDEVFLITLSTTPIADDPALEIKTVTLSPSVTVHLAIKAPQDLTESAQNYLNQVAESLTLRD